MLTDSYVKKTNKDLLEIHKRVITNHLHLLGVKLRNRRKFFQLYDMFINYKNIREYYNYDIEFFITRLVRDELDKIRTYYKEKPKRKKKK